MCIAGEQDLQDEEQRNRGAPSALSVFANLVASVKSLRAGPASACAVANTALRQQNQLLTSSEGSLCISDVG